MFKTRVHGHSKTKTKPPSPTYSTWTSMKQRCNNPAAPNYSSYGGKGITIDLKWESFSGFLEDMGVRPKGRSLDRIDNSLGYSKANCRWATAKQQANNRRHPKTQFDIEFNGETKPLSFWCEKFGVKYHTALWRLHKGWPLADIFGGKYVSYHRGVSPRPSSSERYGGRPGVL